MINDSELEKKAKEFARDLMQKLEKLNEEYKVKMSDEEKKILEEFDKKYPPPTEEELAQGFKEVFINFVKE